MQNESKLLIAFKYLFMRFGDFHFRSEMQKKIWFEPNEQVYWVQNNLVSRFKWPLNSEIAKHFDKNMTQYFAIGAAAAHKT